MYSLERTKIESLVSKIKYIQFILLHNFIQRRADNLVIKLSLAKLHDDFIHITNLQARSVSQSHFDYVCIYINLLYN